jgi:uncharacterized protein (TIGR02996 family)
MVIAVFDLDGSETSWLVYADWLEDQGLDASNIREPGEVNDWYFQHFNDVCSTNFFERLISSALDNVAGRDIQVGTVGHFAYGNVVGMGPNTEDNSVGGKIREVRYKFWYVE